MTSDTFPAPISATPSLSLPSTRFLPEIPASVHSPPGYTNSVAQLSNSKTLAHAGFTLPQNSTPFIEPLSPLPPLLSNLETTLQTVPTAAIPFSTPIAHSAVTDPFSLLERINSRQSYLAQPHYPPALLEYFSRCPPAAFARLGPAGKLCIPGRRQLDNLIYVFGYPKTDDDIAFCMEDVPGLCPNTFHILHSSLISHLTKIRQAAHQSSSEVEEMLIQQMMFRILPREEISRRFQRIVAKCMKARRIIMSKYGAYMKNLRWIENIATKQRRGCLSHCQNNILRLWLFKNFDNPYPNTMEKKKLTQETKLNVTQINNWLINARSRVWKPTLDVMSMARLREEMVRTEQNCRMVKREINPMQEERSGNSSSSQADTHETCMNSNLSWELLQQISTTNGTEMHGLEEGDGSCGVSKIMGTRRAIGLYNSIRTRD